MNNGKLKYGIGGFLIGGFFVWFLTMSAVNANNIGMMQMMGIRPGASDAHFIEQMIPHHEDAITMAKLAQQKATRQEIKNLAQNIIDSQGKEISQMETWYKNWFGKDVPQNQQVMSGHGMMMDTQTMHMGMMGDDTDLRRLEETEDFDKAFIEEMIPHHQMAVMMANMLKNATARPEMRTLADSIITAQTNEIEQMREWLREWNE